MVWMRFVLAAGLLLSGAALAQGAAQGAKERTEGLIEAFQQVRAAERDKSLDAGSRAQNLQAFSRLDGYFDYDHLVGDPIEPHEQALSAEQLARYRELFRELIRTVAYPDAGSFFRRAKWSLKEVDRGEGAVDVEMEAYDAKRDLNTNVTFHWRPRDGILRLADVSFDGDSIVKDYMNQFGRILKKEGPEGLLSRLQKRLDAQRERYGTVP